jgi:hypothetical protein
MRWACIGGLAAVVATLAIVFALSLGLWNYWTASAQDTFIVNDDTTPADGGCDTPDFETEDIEDAIDSALVADGDTLVICEGTYNPPDAIEVTKSLTIEGRPGANRDDIVVQGIASDDGFVIAVGGVTIRHVKLVGANADSGIKILPGADNNAIQDMELTAWDDGVDATLAEGNVVETSKIHTNDDDGVSVIYGGNNTVR